MQETRPNMRFIVLYITAFPTIFTAAESEFWHNNLENKEIS